MLSAAGSRGAGRRDRSRWRRRRRRFATDAGLAGEEAGEVEAAGGVGLADHVEVNAAEVAAEFEVVLVVDPGAGFGDGDGLVDVEVGLLLVESGELGEGEAGQAEIERAGGSVERR